MYSCTNFQSLWKNSDFKTKFAAKNMKEKNSEKINFKIVISIYQCTHAPNFSHFGELQILGPNLPQKINENILKKITIKS